MTWKTNKKTGKKFKNKTLAIKIVPKELVSYMDTQIEALENKGYTIRKLRATEKNIDFHIKKERNVGIGWASGSNSHTTINIGIQHASYPDEISLLVVPYGVENRKQYYYMSNEKFMKGFERNVMQKYVRKK